MLQYLIIRALAAITTINIAPVAAGVITRQDSGSSIIIQNIAFNILSHAGKNDTDEDGLGPYPPWTAFSNTIQYDGKWGECYNEIDYAQNTSGGNDCAGAVDVVSLPTSGCPPPNGDTQNGLNNVTWSITRYGDTYVEQVNVPDQDDMDVVYVACYVFYQSNFTCYPDIDEDFQSQPQSPYQQNLTATVGQVCPTF